MHERILAGLYAAFFLNIAFIFWAIWPISGLLVLMMFVVFLMGSAIVAIKNYYRGMNPSSLPKPNTDDAP